MTSHAARRAEGSKPVVGSSRKISSGSPISASATSRRRRWPPESAVARSSACSCQPDERERLVDRARRAVVAGVEREALAHGQARLGRGFLQHDADPLAPADGRLPAGSAPSTSTLPPLAWRKPSRISTVVVLPAPLGPRKAKISPRRDLQVDPADGLVVAVALVQAADRDDRLARIGERRVRCATAASSEFVSMASKLRRGRPPSSAAGELGPPPAGGERAPTGSTREPMTHARARLIVAARCCALRWFTRHAGTARRADRALPAEVIVAARASASPTWSCLSSITVTSQPRARPARPRRW